MPAPSKATAQRKHVTTACISCRESKVKCDGVTPSCSNCINKNRECLYLAGDDRRKLMLRVAIELLSQRVDQLNQFIGDNGLQAPTLAEHEEASLRKVLKSLGFDHEKVLGKETQSGPNSNRGNSRDVEDFKTKAVENTGPGNQQVASTNQDSSESQKLRNRSGTTTLETQPRLPSQEPLNENLVPQPAGDRSSPLANPSGVVDPTLTNTVTNVQNTNLPNWDWENMNCEGLTFDTNYAPPFSNMRQTSYSNGSPQQGSYNDMLAERSPPSMDDNDDNESVEGLVDQLSDRMGTLQIGADGQIRYYGPTSNFTLIDMPSTDPMHVHRSTREDGQEYLDRLGVGAEVPPDLEDHLINLYFTWQDSSFHIVDREMYENGKRQWHEEMRDTPYYSEALRNAMCSLGAAFEAQHHPDFVTFPKSLADFFADRAKALLEIDLDAPCISTAQAMVVTSCHDMGCTRDARGWLYSGMAVRLAFDLALHKDMTEYVAKGIISQAEANVRRTVFWGTYLVDQVWSFHLGRHFRINMDDVTCGKPSRNLVHSANNLWTPYVTSSVSYAPVAACLEEVSDQRVLLCEIMSPLGQNLYGRSGIDPYMLQELNAKTVIDLLDWEQNLPASLRVNLDDTTTPYLPHVLLMYMHYYQCLIYAHRPWMSRVTAQSQTPQGPGAAHARQICVDAAISIAKILKIYEHRYTLRRVNIQGPAITCSAALLLIFAKISRYGRTRGLNVDEHLGICFRALDAFGQSWESARRSRVFLIRLQRQWELQARQRRLARRPSKPASEFSRKRPLTATDFDTHQGSHHTTWQSDHNYHMGKTHKQSQSAGTSGTADLDLEMNFDFMLEANAQAVSGNWMTGTYARTAPSDLMRFLEDS